LVLNRSIQILSAPSILGLQSYGVQLLPGTLLANGLAERIGALSTIKIVPTLNNQRSDQRDPVTKCLNPVIAHEFSITLGNDLIQTIKQNHFALTLGGDCSILLGIMQGLKGIGNYGLIFIDAHADFYEPEKSTTGELADMDLAIITGRGPEILTNINHRKPYVKDEHVIHIGQRDQEETKKFGSQEIRDTKIKCIPFSEIEKQGPFAPLREIISHIDKINVDGFWIHFDTDVLHDDINPAVDYRLPGGLSFQQTEIIIQQLLQTGKIMGMSVTIYNSSLDANGMIGKNITDSIVRMFSMQNL
jgi:arginase